VAVENLVFLGCNYNDKKIKAQFDSLKKRIESDTPLRCEIVDKRGSKPARDLWQDIKEAIEDSAACVFDVTGFRPNVVLELGYALAIKAEDQLYITFRKRKTKGSIPKWLLSDIGHLRRHEYVSLSDLEKFIRSQLSLIPYSKRMTSFYQDCDTTNAADKYRAAGLAIIQGLRDSGSMSKQQIQGKMAGSNCHFSKMAALLKKDRVAVRGRGANGRFSIPEID
jgi:hypothetical protein